MPSGQQTRQFEVTTKDLDGLSDSRGESIKSMLSADHGIEVHSVRVILGYQVKADISDSDSESLVYDLFADPVIEIGSASSRLLDYFPTAPEAAVQVGYKPGVTDNPGQAGLDGLITLFPDKSSARVSTFRTFAFWGVPDGVSPEDLAATLHNPMIERASIAGKDQCYNGSWPNLGFPETPPATFHGPATVDLEVSDQDLIETVSYTHLTLPTKA